MNENDVRKPLDGVELRPAVRAFAEAMELKLRKGDGKKTHWREQPIEALVRLFKIEMQEFEVADDFFSVAEARGESVDLANYALIVWDRLGMLDQDRNRHEQTPRDASPGVIYIGVDPDIAHTGINGELHKGYHNECAICAPRR